MTNTDLQTLITSELQSLALGCGWQELGDFTEDLMVGFGVRATISDVETAISNSPIGGTYKVSDLIIDKDGDGTVKLPTNVVLLCAEPSELLELNPDTKIVVA